MGVWGCVRVCGCACGGVGVEEVFWGVSDMHGLLL